MAFWILLYTQVIEVFQTEIKEHRKSKKKHKKNKDGSP